MRKTIAPLAHILWSILLLSALVFTACQGGSPGETTPVPQPHESIPDFDMDYEIGRWVALWNSYDLNGVDELFLTDDSVTYFSSEKEGLIKGIEAIREHHRGFGFVEGGKAPEKELWVEDLHANAHGPTAIVTGIWFFGDRSEPREDIQRGPLTFVYVWQTGEYRLAHLHFSNY